MSKHFAIQQDGPWAANRTVFGAAVIFMFSIKPGTSHEVHVFNGVLARFQGNLASFGRFTCIQLHFGRKWPRSSRSPNDGRDCVILRLLPHEMHSSDQAAPENARLAQLANCTNLSWKLRPPSLQKTSQGLVVGLHRKTCA